MVLCYGSLRKLNPGATSIWPALRLWENSFPPLPIQPIRKLKINLKNLWLSLDEVLINPSIYHTGLCRARLSRESDSRRKPLDCDKVQPELPQEDIRATELSEPHHL